MSLMSPPTNSLPQRGQSNRFCRRQLLQTFQHTFCVKIIICILTFLLHQHVAVMTEVNTPL